MSRYTDQTRVTHQSILTSLNVSEQELRARDIKLADLVEIHNDYITRHNELDDIASLIANVLLRENEVHAVRYRVKEPIHLLKKIVRKKKEYPERNLTVHNYLQHINDLAGVRVLHLQREHCFSIGKYIRHTWELKRMPYAYVNDVTTSQSQLLREHGYNVLINPRGYTALHYIIKSKPNKQLYFVEIQAKTLFEEGWSEIDHCIRYPDHEPNALLRYLLHFLNRLTNHSDETAAQIHAIAYELDKYKSSTEADVDQIKQAISHHITKLPLEENEKQQLYTCLAQLKL
ncbi:RelA/SpoT domain-containing protein [Pontibacter sp. E15-1]|uniref:RelA/SpoT domain-containing protein n=1 Tax=Pontibacter sp. E15-1 TaxID=2919918 RepID=UPI001F4FF727|nr:RelA/SpoT domain-containing protein [Pontibacter sp. E15-1]MCJ8167590.1 RelA/SpoT domain-containing protein [Pontibacter sp. E15-1]